MSHPVCLAIFVDCLKKVPDPRSKQGVDDFNEHGSVVGATDADRKTEAASEEEVREVDVDNNAMPILLMKRECLGGRELRSVVV